jgi:hypothetical protein
MKTQAFQGEVLEPEPPSGPFNWTKACLNGHSSEQFRIPAPVSAIKPYIQHIMSEHKVSEVFVIEQEVLSLYSTIHPFGPNPLMNHS